VLADADHEDLAGHVEFRPPAQAVEVEAARPVEVRDGEGDEADPLVHAHDLKEMRPGGPSPRP